MREIDFRMWDSTTKKYFYDPINVFDCLKHQSLFDKKLGFLAFNHIAGGRVFEQYTGLNDKNGDKIFEGDILSTDCDGNSFFYVIFFEGSYCLEYNGNTQGRSHICEKRAHGLVVVGNIHENPEMVDP